MKKLLTITAILLLTATVAKATGHQEHRAVWNTAMLSDWPYQALSDANAEEQKAKGIRMLDSLAVNNFTTVYYHARSHSDAMYESSYEPWSNSVSAAGRGHKPPFDPFQFLIEEGHKRGIEIYAWINPFRYTGNTTIPDEYRNCNIDYCNTHPEWLLKNSTQIVLNPGIPEVRQRVLDVIKEIVTKYDVDGIVFDDYFYGQGGTPETADAPDYKQYTESGTSLKIGDWRRENINNFVAEVQKTIKTAKPWVRFGISPAGICGTNSTSAPKYGVDPCPGSDWQYSTIYSDPLNWMVNGTVDYMSPQIYWHDTYKGISSWWYYIAQKFNRHVFPSQMISDNEQKIPQFSTYINEINLNRSNSSHKAPGYVFFPWLNFFNARKIVNRKQVRLMATLRFEVFNTRAYTPPMQWEAAGKTPVPTNVAFNGTKLTWNGESNSRFMVYAYPKTLDKANFHAQEEYAHAIVYTNEFTPDAETAANCNFAVATLDRRGNESSAVNSGATVGNAPAISLANFTDGEKTTGGIFTLRWTSNARQFFIELAEDPQFSKIIYNKLCYDKYINSDKLPAMEEGKTVYWRVRSMATDCNDTYSSTGRFTSAKFALTYPAQTTPFVKQTDTFTWVKAEGASYTLQISESMNFDNPAYETTTDDSKAIIPEKTLVAGASYYARLIAKLNNSEIASEPLLFRVESIGATVPEFTKPASDGVTLYSDDALAVNLQLGASKVRIEIAANDKFAPRTTGNFELEAFQTVADKKLSENTRPRLTDGSTYYLRVRASYIDAEGKTINTEFSPVRTFVYSSKSGVENVGSDSARIFVEGGIIFTSAKASSIEVYNASGMLIDSAAETTSIAAPENRGAYIIKANINGKPIVQKIIL